MTPDETARLHCPPQDSATWTVPFSLVGEPNPKTWPTWTLCCHPRALSMVRQTAIDSKLSTYDTNLPKAR